jgi:hypothetical protein
MLEDKLLDNTLDILNKNGASAAYTYLLLNKDNVENLSSQAYNFLYCLSAMLNLKSESLAWIREVIIDKEYWYRPEVFDDEDLLCISDEPEFLKYKSISDERYYKAFEKTNTICTLQEINKNKLVLVLHGNQQNIHSCGDFWLYLEKQGYQVEYVQSKTIDSYMLYRWEDEGETQLDKVINKLPWDKYDSHTLCGFSAGCNEILKTLLNSTVKCDKVILHSPWIPIVDTKLDELLQALHNINIEIICGENDEDCLPNAKKLADKVIEQGLKCSLNIVKGLGHSYSN